MLPLPRDNICVTSWLIVQGGPRLGLGSESIRCKSGYFSVEDFDGDTAITAAHQHDESSSSTLK